jgi:hypothetical protein
MLNAEFNADSVCRFLLELLVELKRTPSDREAMKGFNHLHPVREETTVLSKE